jgi:hypothetical protein
VGTVSIQYLRVLGGVDGEVRKGLNALFRKQALEKREEEKASFAETPEVLQNMREPLQNPFFEPLLRATDEMHPHVGPAGVCLSPWGAFPRDQGPLLPLRPIRRPASPGR